MFGHNLKDYATRGQLALYYKNQFGVALLRLGDALRFLPPSHRCRGINELELEHVMKMILALLILCSAIALPALGALTDADLNEIRLIVNDAIDASEKQMAEKIQASEARMKEHINTKMESVDKRLSLVTTLIVGLIALIVLAVGIPQIIMAWRSRKDRSLETQIEKLTQEIETLKQQRIVQP